MPPDIQNILNSVRQDMWKQKVQKIQQGMKKYEDWCLKPSRYTPDEIVTKFLNPILRTYWEVFHTHNIYRRKQGELPSQKDDNSQLRCYDVGIFLVGFSSLPIALSLAEIQPSQEIYFLYSSGTDGTKDTCCEIADRMKAMLKGQNCFDALIDRVNSSVCDLGKFGLEVTNPSDPVETFKRIKEVIDKVGNKSIALDLTGGKKTMIGGGFTAGSILDFADSIENSGCDMFYIDSLAYDQRRGSPTSGTEFLTRLDNPYNVYNVQSVQQAEKLFEQHNYEEAASLWESVDEKLNIYAKRYSLEREQEAIEKALYMADCYGLWDAFDYIAAKMSKDNGNNGDLWNYNNKHTYNVPPASIDILEILSQVRNQQTLFAEQARIIHYAVDRYQNGVRRMESDRFDDAIVRFTQVIEILCKYRIYQIAERNGLTDSSHTPVSADACLCERWELTQLIRFLFGKRRTYRSRTYDERYQIAHLDEKLQIVDYNNYKCVDQITDSIVPRNNFIHVRNTPGWQEMQQDAEDLQDLAWEFLKNLSYNYRAISDLSFDALLELHEFRR